MGQEQEFYPIPIFQARIHLKAMDLLDHLTIFTNELNRLAQQFGHFGQPSAEEHCLKYAPFDL